MTEKDEQEIENKILEFKETTKTDKNIIMTMITSKGLEQNEHSDVVQKELLLENLFC